MHMHEQAIAVGGRKVDGRNDEHGHAGDHAPFDRDVEALANGCDIGRNRSGTLRHQLFPGGGGLRRDVPARRIGRGNERLERRAHRIGNRQCACRQRTRRERMGGHCRRFCGRDRQHGRHIGPASSTRREIPL